MSETQLVQAQPSYLLRLPYAMPFPPFQDWFLWLVLNFLLSIDVPNINSCRWRR